MIIPVRSLVLALSVLIAVALVGYGSWAYADGRPPFGPSDDKWTGVFLTNGQAYFGHFYAGPGEFASLREVYYVLATQLQPPEGQPAGSQTQLSLQRLGSEVHGPQQDMRIAKSQILFIEELRPDSPLVQSIGQLKIQPAPAPGTQATAMPRPPTSAPAASPSPSPARSPSPSPR